jgi:hypothetical protein
MRFFILDIIAILLGVWWVKAFRLGRRCNRTASPEGL